MMHLPHPNMAEEMRDYAHKADDDWLPWKPVLSTVTNEDIVELEQKIQLTYLKLYIDFLKYKHFYELWPVEEITFFEHGIYEWKKKLLDKYFLSWLPDKLIDKGYICFADYEDWGIVCFDTTRRTGQDGDCEIIMVDHELLYDDPTPKRVLYSSFAEMIHTLVGAQKSMYPLP